MLECVSSAGLHNFCLHLPSLQTQRSECDQGELSLKGKVLAQLSLMATRPAFSRTVNVYCQPFVSAAQLRETVVGELVQCINSFHAKGLHNYRLLAYSRLLQKSSSMSYQTIFKDFMDPNNHYS